MIQGNPMRQSHIMKKILVYSYVITVWTGLKIYHWVKKEEKGFKAW
jgi:hypothetical protein